MELVNNLIKDFNIKVKNIRTFNDLPFIFQYISDLKFNNISGNGGGVSFNQKEALLKSVFESIERYCLFYNKKEYKNFIRSSIKDLDKKNIKYIHINNHQYFSIKQINNNSRELKIENKDKLYWVEGIDFYRNKEILIPCQLIFLNSGDKEKIIQQPISTGAAGGKTLNDAILRGTFEIIERDAFMIHYLAKTYGELIDFSMNKRLMKIKKYFKQYNLDLHLINLPTDLNVYTIMCLIIDRNVLGVPLSVGMKTGLNPLEVSLKAIEESYMSVSFSRKDLIELKDALKSITPNTITSIHQRTLYWLDRDKLRYINPWIKNKRKIKFNKMRNLSKGSINNNLKFVNNILKSKNHNIYYVNIKKEEFSKYNEFEVVKVVIPTLHPFYLEEKYKYLGGNRIYDIPVKLGYYENPLKEEKLNQIPHFFL